MLCKKTNSKAEIDKWVNQGYEAYQKGDYGEALRLWGLAAEQGNSVAQFNLGVMYANGRGGLLKDDVKAVEWNQKAAEQGEADAQYNLGVMYANGRGGLSKNDVKAVEWYQKAADQGYAYAQCILGVMYANGHGGLPKDDVKAVEWY
jgi:uncharacterized protein